MEQMTFLLCRLWFWKIYCVEEKTLMFVGCYVKWLLLRKESEKLSSALQKSRMIAGGLSNVMRSLLLFVVV